MGDSIGRRAEFSFGLTVAIVVAALLAACGSAPIEPAPTASTNTAPPGQPVKTEFEGYVVEAVSEPTEISSEVLRTRYGPLVQASLTSRPSLQCGIRAELTAAVARGVFRVGVAGGGDVFRPVWPTDATLVHATCKGGSALMVIDSATEAVVAFEVTETLP